MSNEEVYILIRTKSTEDKNMVVDYIEEGEQNDYVPDDLETWSFHGKLNLYEHVKSIQFGGK
jgi:hypothetical protein